MRYCPKCFDEYRDEISQCAQCGVPLVTRDELDKLPEYRRAGGIHAGRFVQATTAEDPFDSEAFCDALEAAGIPVMSIPRRGSAVDPITTGTTHGWWEIRVPEERLKDAGPVIDARRQELRLAEKDAGDAAEAEELEGEAGSTDRGSRRV